MLSVVAFVVACRAYACRYPPKHRWTWVLSWLVMAILLGLGVAAVPALIYGQICGRSGCSTVTDGYLQTSGGGRRPRDLA